MRTAILFPGQAGQTPDVRDLVAEVRPDLLALAAYVVGLMPRAGEASGTGGMLAVLGAGDAIAQRHGVAVANDNAAGQPVLSGAKAAQEAVSSDARAAGLKTIALGVAGAFPSTHMAPAVEEFAEAVAAVEVGEPRLEVFSCVTAAPLADASERATTNA